MTVLIKSGTDYSKEKMFQPITELVLAGFEAKFTHSLFSKKEAHKIAEIIALVCLAEPKDFLIAEKDNKIVGCLYLVSSTKKTKLLNTYLKSAFSVAERTKVLFLLAFLSHKPKQNEDHIDFIAVFENFRGLGIGRQLINYCQKQSDKEFLTLHVAKGNLNAVYLYESEGFEIQDELGSTIGEKMTGIRDWWFMRK